MILYDLKHNGIYRHELYNGIVLVSAKNISIFIFLSTPLLVS